MEGGHGPPSEMDIPNFTVQGAIARGNECLQTGDIHAAIQYFTDAAAVDPDSYEARLGLGLAYAKAGDPEMAVAALEACVRVRPDSHEALCHLGAAYRSAGQTDAAIAAYERAVRLRPEYAPAREALVALSPHSPALRSRGDAGVLGACPVCNTPIPAVPVGKLCSLCGLNLAGIHGGFVKVVRDGRDGQGFACAACGGPVDRVDGVCPRCGTNLLTGTRLQTVEGQDSDSHSPPIGPNMSWHREAIPPIHLRVLAVLIDGVALGLVGELIAALLGVPQGLFWVVLIGLEVGFLARYGATPGKMWCGMSVDMVDGSDVALGPAMVRTTLKWLFPAAQSWLVIMALSSHSPVVASMRAGAEACRGASPLAPVFLVQLAVAKAIHIQGLEDVSLPLAALGMLVNTSVAHAWALFTPLRRTLYDYIAGTLVTGGGR